MAEIVAAAAAVVGAGYAIANGVDQSRRQGIAVGRQKAAQGQAETRAANESRRAGEEIVRARRDVPNLGDLFADEQLQAGRGPQSTLLTGATRGAAASSLLGS